VRGVLLVMAGGAAGALARYTVGLLFSQLRISAVWATLAVNVSGSLVLGFLLALLVSRFSTAAPFNWWQGWASWAVSRPSPP
jgi:CrcB protein